MSRPNAEDLVRTAIAAPEADVMPDLRSAYARQTATAILGLLRQVEARMQLEVAVRREDIADLRAVLEMFRDGLSRPWAAEDSTRTQLLRDLEAALAAPSEAGELSDGSRPADAADA